MTVSASSRISCLNGNCLFIDSLRIGMMDLRIANYDRMNLECGSEMMFLTMQLSPVGSISDQGWQISTTSRFFTDVIMPVCFRVWLKALINSIALYCLMKSLENYNIRVVRTYLLSDDIRKLCSKANSKSHPKLMKYLLRILSFYNNFEYYSNAIKNRASIHCSEWFSMMRSAAILSVLLLAFSSLIFKYFWSMSPAVFSIKGNALCQITFTVGFSVTRINILRRKNCDEIQMSAESLEMIQSQSCWEGANDSKDQRSLERKDQVGVWTSQRYVEGCFQSAVRERFSMGFQFEKIDCLVFQGSSKRLEKKIVTDLGRFSSLPISSMMVLIVSQRGV